MHASHNNQPQVVVVGGGPTGVELAGSFVELTRRVLKRDFCKIDPRQARVILLEAMPRLLRLSARAVAQLTRLGVEVWTNVRVENIGDLALMRDERGQPVPGVSPAAMQMARHAARMIEADLNNENTNPGARPAFEFRDHQTQRTRRGHTV